VLQRKSCQNDIFLSFLVLVQLCTKCTITGQREDGPAAVPLYRHHKSFFSRHRSRPIMKHYSMLWYYRPTYLHYSYLQIYNFQLLTKLHTANADWFKFHSNGGLGYRFGTLRSYTSFFGHFPGTSLKSPRQLYKIADRFLSITLFSLVYSASNAISLSVPVNLGLCALCITDCKKQRRGCLERDFVLRHKTETVGARPRPRQ